jgi:hypothetical protein
MKAVRQLEIENRGTDDTPFGFVYAGRSARALFNNLDGELSLYHSRGWQQLTKAEIAKADALLRSTFPVFAKP